MEKFDIHKLQFPIGKFTTPKLITNDILKKWISVIADFPNQLEFEVENLTEFELLWIYRPGGWNIKQIVNHCADSHMNSFIRFKLALTEDTPVIKPYEESRWAVMKDYTDVSIEHSLNIIRGLHFRWSVLLKDLKEDEIKRKFFHPEHKVEISLDTNIGLYSWHCLHHLEHIKLAKKLKDKFLN